ncbi:MAG TPA: hypothetical protein H9796_13670 [Candidatus Butyricimonas faecavium]|nr:hypothetical protein [Candidatus Butyricimonas faecavium]
MRIEKKAEKDEKNKTEKKRSKNKFVRGRWFPLLCFVLLFVIVFVVAGLCGFRITYASELETSWDAVSAVAAWAAVIVAVLSAGASVGAIWAAIRVPQKIADRQDKIALFEKRYKCYIAVQTLLVCGKQISMDGKTPLDIQKYMMMYFGQPDDYSFENSQEKYQMILKQNEIIIISGEFLFSGFKAEPIQEISRAATELFVLVSAFPDGANRKPLPQYVAKCRDEYCNLCNQYMDRYIELMEKELQLSLK